MSSYWYKDRQSFLTAVFSDKRWDKGWEIYEGEEVVYVE